jgi:hypothetical protein
MFVFCIVLGGCADCGKSDKAGTESQPVTTASGNPSKFPQERHPLAPFIDAGQK